jgi:hypothetical protein
MANDLAKYSDQSFNIINNSSILEPKDFEQLAALKDELQETFLRTQIFRTRTEMEVSVLDDIHFPTPDSKYWQAQREQNVMFSELVRMSYEYRKNLVEIKKLQREYDEEEDDLEKELKKIEIERKQFESREMERMAKDRIREVQQWHEIKAKLVPKMVNSTLNVNDHQLVSYTQEWLREALLMPPTIQQGEMVNLVGKLNSALKMCFDMGLVDKVMADLNHNDKEFLLQRGVRWQY